MQYKVLKIEEDIDFGREERQPGEKTYVRCSAGERRWM